MERITSTAYLKPLDFEGQVPSSWRPAPELAASFIGGAVRGRMARQDGGTSTQTAAVMIMIIVCHDHCDGGGCGALQS